MRRAGGTTPVAHSSLLVGDAAVLFFSLLVFTCRRLHSVGASRTDGKQTTGGLAGGRRACGGFLRCGGTPPASLWRNVWRWARSWVARTCFFLCVMRETEKSPTLKPLLLAWRGAAPQECSQLSWRRCVHSRP
ncbi:hypothetical protein TcCL_NonESM12473 [Trypanosoma cruzi]|nr:hypothetical protein TcCL_NonESM12473 [Trypanosoma cruzi]